MRARDTFASNGRKASQFVVKWKITLEPRCNGMNIFYKARAYKADTLHLQRQEHRG